MASAPNRVAPGSPAPSSPAPSAPPPAQPAPRASTVSPSPPVRPAAPVHPVHSEREDRPTAPPPAGAVAEVRRGAEAEQVTGRAGARAATRDGVVYLPDRAGPIDAPVAQGLLAHELVHVRAHQPHHPGTHPEPDRPDTAVDVGGDGTDGDGEERTAQAVEAAVRSGRAQAPAVLRHQPPTATTAVHLDTPPATWTYVADPPATPHHAPSSSPSSSSGSAPTLHTAPEAPRAEPAPEDRSTRPQDDDLDRLYRLLRARLLDDLLVDRERTGGVIDLRRG